MLGFWVIVHVWFLQVALIRCTENSTGFELGYVDPRGHHYDSPSVVRYSAPENHHLCLLGGRALGSDVVWTREDGKVLVTRHGSYETNQDRRSFLLLSDGSLCLLRLHQSDNGEYRYNQRLVAELQVLAGHDFAVAAGRTLLLPCGGSSRLKQKWFQRRAGGRREAILTRYRNGTVRRERDDGRISLEKDALQIVDLQPSDAGEYFCNGELQAKVAVAAAHPEPTGSPSSSSSTAPPAVVKTDVVDRKKKEKRVEGALLIAAVVGFGLIILFMVGACLMMTCVKCRKRKYSQAAAQDHEDTELQPWKTPSRQTDRKAPEIPAEETLHYASLGRPTWRERACRTPPPPPPQQSPHNVIYSAVVTRPAAHASHKHARLV